MKRWLIWAVVGMFFLQLLYTEGACSTSEDTNQYGYEWTFELKEDDGSVSGEVEITLGESCSSYSLTFPEGYEVDVTKAEEVKTEEPKSIKWKTKDRTYTFEFGDQEKGFQFRVEFDVVGIVMKADEVYIFSWDWIETHNIFHRATVVLPEKHELLSKKYLTPTEISPDQDQISVIFAKEVSESEPFKFGITFSKKGKELIEKAEEYFDQGLYEEARLTYEEAYTFYSNSEFSVIDNRKKDEFLSELEEHIEFIGYLLQRMDIYDWTFELKEGGSVHVEVEITLGMPCSLYSFSFPKGPLVEIVRAQEIKTGENIDVTETEEDDKIRYTFNFEEQKEKGFQFIVEFDQERRVTDQEEIKDEVYYFYWKWTIDNRASHTATVILPEKHELLSAVYVDPTEVPSDQDQTSVIFEKEVSELEPFKFGITFSKKGKVLIEKGDEHLRLRQYDEAELAYEEAIAFYSDYPMINNPKKYGILIDLQNELLKINSVQDPQAKDTYEWTFTCVDDSVHARVEITLGSPRFLYSFDFPVRHAAENVEARKVTAETKSKIDIVEFDEEGEKKYVLEFKEKKEGQFIVEFDQDNRVRIEDEIYYYFYWEWTTNNKASHTATVILPEKHELSSVEYMDPTNVPSYQDKTSVIFEKEVSESESFKFGITFSKKGKELIEEGRSKFNQGKEHSDKKLCEEARSAYLEAITFYSKFEIIYNQDKDEFLAALEKNVKEINEFLQEPEDPFTHVWTFELKEDCSAHVEVEITLGSPRLSYSFVLPNSYSAKNIEKGEDIEVTAVEEEDKWRYVCEFDVEKENGFIFFIKFDLENVVEEKRDISNFSWEWEIDHITSHTAAVNLPREYEVFSEEPLKIIFLPDHQISVQLEEDVPESETFEFKVAFSKIGSDFIKAGIDLFEDGVEHKNEVVCEEARVAYENAENFYSSLQYKMVNSKEKGEIMDEIEKRKEEIIEHLGIRDKAAENFKEAQEALKESNFEGAREHAGTAKTYYEILDNVERQAECHEVIAEAYLEERNFDKAREHAEMAKNEDLIIRIDKEEKWWYIKLTAVAMAILSVLAFVVYRQKIFKEIPNPYIVATAVKSENMFFGREDVFKFIKGEFSAEKKNIAIVLHGERKTGKTSILYQIENRRLGEKFIPVYVDMQIMARVDDKGFLRRITEEILNSLVKFSIIDQESNEYFEINKIIEEYKTESNPYTVFSNFLHKVSSLLQDRYLIIMFDEFDLFFSKVKSNHLSPELSQYMRSLIQDKERLAFIFAGSQRELRGADKEWIRTFSDASARRISFLEKEDALELMHVPVNNKIKYSKEAEDKLLRLTACQPFFLQLFLSNLVNLVNNNRRTGVDVKEIEKVLDKTLNSFPLHMLHIWDVDSTPEERIVLSALAEIIRSEDQYVSVKEVEETLLKNEVTLDERAIRKTSEGLIDKEILHREEDAYNFRIDFIRYWVKNEHTLIETVIEIEEAAEKEKTEGEIK